MDEKGFLLGLSNRVKVIIRRGRKKAEEMNDGSRDWITVVETCCADNTMLPPLTIFKGKSIQWDWVKGLRPQDDDACFTYSDKGYITDDLALRWLRDNFDKWTTEKANGEPRLLLFDAHRTH